MTYVDGYIVPVPEDRLEDYKKIASGAGALWIEHGALSYKECVLEDAEPEMPEDCPADMRPALFKDLMGTKDGETVIFAFVTYKSREHRDEVNAKVMSDPRMEEACGSDMDGGMPFDCARMAFGGFSAFVDL